MKSMVAAGLICALCAWEAVTSFAESAPGAAGQLHLITGRVVSYGVTSSGPNSKAIDGDIQVDGENSARCFTVYRSDSIADTAGMLLAAWRGQRLVTAKAYRLNKCEELVAVAPACDSQPRDSTRCTIKATEVRPNSEMRKHNGRWLKDLVGTSCSVPGGDQGRTCRGTISTLSVAGNDYQLILAGGPKDGPRCFTGHRGAAADLNPEAAEAKLAIAATAWAMDHRVAIVAYPATGTAPDYCRVAEGNDPCLCIIQIGFDFEQRHGR